MLNKTPVLALSLHILTDSLQNMVPAIDSMVEGGATTISQQQLQEQEKRIEISCALAAEASRRSRFLSGELFNLMLPHFITLLQTTLYNYKSQERAYSPYHITFVPISFYHLLLFSAIVDYCNDYEFVKHTFLNNFHFVVFV